MARLTRMLLVIAFAGLAACSETPPSKPQPTEAQKEALLEANVILTACAASDIEQVKALLEENPALVNAQDDTGATPLWRAVGALHPSEELVKLLLEKGANVDGGAPLQLAAGRGRKDFLVMLLKHGAKIEARDRYGRTALAYAAWGNRSEVADVLIARGAKLNVFEAAALGKMKKLEEFLRADPKAVNATDDQGLTPLHWAALIGHAEAVRFLLAHKADRFVPDRRGYSSCAAARARNHPEIVELMRCP